MLEFWKKKRNKATSYEDKIRAIIAPDNIGMPSPKKIVELGNDAIPVIIQVFLTPYDPQLDIPGDQSILTYALCDFAKMGSLEANNFLKRVAAGEVPLYDSGGQRANEIARSFFAKEIHKKEQALKMAIESEPWEKYSEYVRIPEGVPDTERNSNMRFQFVFHDKVEATRIMSNLPDNIRVALHTPYREGDVGVLPGMEKDIEGKYLIWYEDVSLTIKEAKDLMNKVVEGGGRIYESFLS